MIGWLLPTVVLSSPANVPAVSPVTGVVVLASPVDASAASQVTGVVRAPDGAPLAGATVRIGDALGVTSEDGSFNLSAPALGATLSVEASGYETLSLALEGPALTDLTLVLTPLRKSDAELTVRGRRAPAGQTRHTLDRETLRGVAGTGGDPLRALTLMPGFARSPYGSGNLIIRGARESSSAVFVDGMEVPNVFHFGFGPSVFAPDMIDRIDYYPGNFPVRYGQVTAGVVDVALRPGDADHWQGAADVDLADAGVFAQGPVGEKTSIALSTRRSYVDAVLNAAADWFGIDNAKNVVPVYWDYQGRIDHRPDPRNRLSLLWVGSRDRVTFLSDESDGDAEEITSSAQYERLKFTLSTRLTTDSTLTLSPSIGRDESSTSGGEDEGGGDPNEGGGGDGSESETRQERALRLELTSKFSETWRGLVGADFVSRSPGATVSTRQPPVVRSPGGGFDSGQRSSQSEANLLIGAPYAELTARYPFGLTVTPAVRADVYTAAGGWGATVDPRLTVRQAASEAVTLKVALGRVSQVLGIVRAEEDGDAVPIDSARAWQYGVGVEWLPALHTAVNSDLWMTRRTNAGRPRYELSADDEGNAWSYAETRYGQFRAYGWELLLKRAPAARVSGWISYSLSRVEVRRRRDEAWERSDWDATHRLTTVWMARLPSGFGVGLSGTLASGYRNGVYGGALDVGSGDYTALQDEYETDHRQPLYAQVDLRVEKAITGEVFDVVGYVDLINAGNATNTEAWEWDYRYRAPRPIRGMPVFPAMGVQVKLK